LLAARGDGASVASAAHLGIAALRLDRSVDWVSRTWQTTTSILCTASGLIGPERARLLAHLTPVSALENSHCEFRIRLIDSSFSFAQISCGATITDLSRKETR